MVGRIENLMGRKNLISRIFETDRVILEYLLDNMFSTENLRALVNSDTDNVDSPPMHR